MKTRFDERVWLDNHGKSHSFPSLETDHLLNIAKMIYSRPEVVIRMMIRDIEKESRRIERLTPGSVSTGDPVRESIRSITGMDAKKIVDYAFSSPLGQELQLAIEARGICLGNYLLLCENSIAIPSNVNEKVKTGG